MTGRGWLSCGIIGVLVWLAPAGISCFAQKKDYLNLAEADKIRDAETPSLRVKLFLTFAAERVRKLQYELSRPSTGSDRRRAELLNSLLNGYTGCVDDAAELIELAGEKQQDIRQGIKEVQSRAAEFLKYLEQLAASGPERESYQRNLDDAIEATRDAIKEAEKAEKEHAPPPIRRKQ